MPSTSLRQSVLTSARRVVIKLGTQLLAAPAAAPAGLDADYIADIARQIAALRRRKLEVTLVSSGAIGAGCMELGLEQRPRDVADLQAVAAVGQGRLMTMMHGAFKARGVNVAQLLLTRNDFDDRARFLNIRNCVTHLHRIGCVPVINENDTVAVDELRFGDNDMLAALMCNALRAHALILLFPLDGLLDDRGRPIDMISDVAAAEKAVWPTKSELGTGGMASKLAAARLVSDAGELAVIANGREPDILTRLIAGEPLGTVFAPAPRRLKSRQRWIGMTKRPAGTLTIDEGAAAAIGARGKSLLATGVIQVDGSFAHGQLVLVHDQTGRELARGLVNYAADELRAIKGKRSNQFERILGSKAYDEVIHRDNLVLTPRP